MNRKTVGLGLGWGVGIGVGVVEKKDAAHYDNNYSARTIRPQLI